MIGGMLVCATVLSGEESVLRGVLRDISAFREEALQVQSPKNTVAQEQRAGEQYGQLFGTEQVHR